MTDGYVYITPFEVEWQVVVARPEMDKESGKELFGYRVSFVAPTRDEALAHGEHQAKELSLPFEGEIR